MIAILEDDPGRAEAMRAKRVIPYGGYDWIDPLWHPELRAALGR